MVASKADLYEILCRNDYYLPNIKTVNSTYLQGVLMRAIWAPKCLEVKMAPWRPRYPPKDDIAQELKNWHA